MVTRNTYKTVQETCIKKQLVRLGHWETCQAPALFGGFGGGGLFSGHGSHGCGSSCGAAACGTSGCNDACNTNCARTRTKKTWVSCPEYRDCPVTVCTKVCVPETVKCKVPVCKTEWREEKVKVCTYQCVTENVVQKYTVNVSKQVTCKATRTVRVCVPFEETVTCCKMVPRTVTRQVADNCNTGNACPSTGCSNSNSCESNRCGLFSRSGGGLFQGLRCNSHCNRGSSSCN